MFAQDTCKKESDAIWILKGIAILTVLAAHVIMPRDENIFHNIPIIFWKMLSNVGVMCFFICSGFFYKREKGDGVKFWRKKVKTLFLPWLLCGTLTYFVNTVVLGKRLLILDYVYWVTGHATWYYFIAVQVFLLFIFKWIWNKENLLWLSVGLTLLWRTLGIWNLVPLLPDAIISPYQDVFNWIGFFALGILIKKHNWQAELRKFRYQGFFLVITVVTCIFIIYTNCYSSFNILQVVKGIAIAVCLWGISNLLTGTRLKEFFIRAGKDSFCIYLLHMQIVQPICFRLGNNAVMHLLRPVIALFIMEIIIYFARSITNHIKGGIKIQELVGLR